MSLAFFSSTVFVTFCIFFFLLNFGRIRHHFSQYENTFLSEMVLQHILDDKHRVPLGTAEVKDSAGFPTTLNLLRGHAAAWEARSQVPFCIEMRNYLKIRLVSYKALLLVLICSTFPLMFFLLLLSCLPCQRLFGS